jgi:hypothetical protein
MAGQTADKWSNILTIRARKSGSVPATIEDLAERFLQRYARRRMRERTWWETARILGFKTDPSDPEKLIRTGDGVAKAWKGRIISEIKRADVVELINQIVDRGSPQNGQSDARLDAENVFLGCESGHRNSVSLSWCKVAGSRDGAGSPFIRFPSSK